jgi:hypothetical protein
VTSLTASTLNSRVNVRRGLPIVDLLTKSLHSFLSAHHPWGSPVDKFMMIARFSILIAVCPG